MKKKHLGVTLKIFALVFLIVITFFYSAFKYYPSYFISEASLRKAEFLSPDENILVSFSIPVREKYYASGIKILPEAEFELSWEKFGQELKIKPRNFWKPDTRYEIFLPKGKSIIFFPVSAQKISFITEKYPEVAKVSPRDKEEEVIIDIEGPIKIALKKSSQKYYLKFLLNGESDFFVENNPEKTQFKILPKKGVSDATMYKLEIFAKYISDKNDEYEKIHESHFTTAFPQKVDWDENYEIRLAQVRKYTRPKIVSEKYVDINLSAQILSLFENGKIRESFMISSGKKGMDTPKGQTQIYNKAPRAYSRAYGLYMPFWMAIRADGKFGLHELPEWPGGYKEGASHLGIPVSHGCVRLGVGAAEKVYSWAEIGTPVVIY